ncbi:MAG: aldo/keto reductase [Chloroflexi bacterium]|nr:aldo/keto reductase [Chloroflexota bacterium]MCL5273784.1 aldo/keto reductase [Chloroflexota bacterium]
MEYRNLGKAGVKVSPVCLGTAFRGSRNDEGLCIRTIERAIEQGINFIDCANVYGTESIVAKALKGKRDDIVLTTKVHSRIGPGPNDRSSSRYHIMREAERSLKRLEVDHIDIYLLHGFDETTPIEETVRAMDDLARQGKIRYFGACNFNAWQVCEALWKCEAWGLDSFIGIQPQYNLLNRAEVEPELMPLCRKYGLGMMTYSPLAIGLLTGLFRRGQPPPAGTPWAGGSRSYDFELAMSEQADQIVQKLIYLAATRGKTPGQVAMAWILSHPEITSIIIGPDRPEHVDENLGALGWNLSSQERVELDEVSRHEHPRKFA